MHDGKPVIDPKKASSNQLKELFGKVIPDYDKEAVYVSDMKKVFGWYNTLLEKDILEFTEEEETEKEAEVEAEAEETEQETTETEAEKDE